MLKKLVVIFFMSVIVNGIILYGFKDSFLSHQKTIELQAQFHEQASELQSVSVNLYLVQKAMEQAQLTYRNYLLSNINPATSGFGVPNLSSVNLVVPKDVSALPSDKILALPASIKQVVGINNLIQPISESIFHQPLVEQSFIVNITDKDLIFPSKLPIASDSSYNQLFNWLYQKQPQLSKVITQAQSIFVPPIFDPQLGTSSEYIILPLAKVEGTMAILVAKINMKLRSLEGRRDFSYIVWDSISGKTVKTNIEEPLTSNSQTAQVYLATRYLPDTLRYVATYGGELPKEQQVARIAKSKDNASIVYLLSNVKNTPYQVIFFKQASTLLTNLNNEAYWFLIKIALINFIVILFIFALVVWKIAFPASRLIDHIEKQSSLYEKEKPLTIKGWEKWFDKVTLAYKDNHKLLQSLMAKNLHLDQIVQTRTEELQAQTTTKDRNIALNRSIMNSIPDMIYYKNLDGGFLGCNSAFEYFAGESESNIVARHADDIFDQATADEITKFDFQALRSKRPFNGKSEHTFPNNRQAIILWLVAPIVDSEGEVHGLLGLGRDITEQEASVNKIEQARQEAVEANETKSHFIANMSHEIRTPMNAVMGMLELIRDSNPTLEQINYINVAQTSSRHLIQIINDILDFSKVSANKIELHCETFAFSSIVDIAFANSLPDALDKGLLLDVKLSPDFPELFEGDQLRIAQIFINLIGNAVKFTEAGSVILEANLVREQNNIQTVEFKVIDTGVGIAQDKQDAVFEAFTQADSSITREFGGTGLGLTIVYQLVKLMGGETELWSKAGIGSEFTVTFNLGKVSEQTNNQYIRKNWVICEHNIDFIETIKSKLKSTKQIHRILSPAEILKSRIFENEVIICRPDIVAILPAAIVERIISGEIELQPVTFQLNELATNCLYTIPHYPVLTMPFTTNKLLLNQLQPKVLAVRPDTKRPVFDGLVILVIEDNEVNQQVLTLILANEGAKVVCADNGEVGINTLKQQTFDLVILDLQMPIMDGITCTKMIRENPKWQQLPIIAMTAHNTEADHLSTKLAGVNLHLNKPIEKDKLVSAITSLCPDHNANEKNGDAFTKEENVKQLNVMELDKRYPNLDWRFLGRQFGQDYVTISTLLARFKQSKQAVLSKLQAEFEHIDQTELKAALHNFKGMFGSIGAHKLAALTASLEQEIKTEVNSQTLVQWQNEIEELFTFIDSMQQ